MAGPNWYRSVSVCRRIVPVVDAGRHYDLGVEFDSVLGELSELRDDFRCRWIPQEIAAHHRVGGVHRDIQR